MKIVVYMLKERAPMFIEFAMRLSVCGVGTAYPAVLLITAENDPRVAPWQSRKFAATLQKANTSPRPILLITRRGEGHGVTSSFSQRVGNLGAELSFFRGRARPGASASADLTV